MRQNQPTPRGGAWFALRKFFTSAFVIFTFAVYAIHQRLALADSGSDVVIPADTSLVVSDLPAETPIVPTATVLVPTPTVVPPTAISSPMPPTATKIPPTASSKSVVLQLHPSLTPFPSATAIPPTATLVPPSATSIPPTVTLIPPTATATKTGLYRNGQYTGPVTDAYYGNVQVKVTISGGKITNVQFLDYPHDRRTSQVINSYATPYLRKEAIAAQSAQVNLISGATLTSEAFVQSLQSALMVAKS